MFRFQFTVKTSNVQKYTLMMSAAFFVLVLCNQVHKINYIGAIYVVGAILLGKIEYIRHIKYALSLSSLGCVFDFFHLSFYTSDSNFLFIKSIEFMAHLLIFLYEMVWIVGVVCFMKQKEELEKKKENDEQLGRFPPSGSRNPTSTVLNHPSTS